MICLLNPTLSPKVQNLSRVTSNTLFWPISHLNESSTSTKSWESNGFDDLNIWFAVRKAKFIVHLKWKQSPKKVSIFHHNLWSKNVCVCGCINFKNTFKKTCPPNHYINVCLWYTCVCVSVCVCICLSVCVCLCAMVELMLVCFSVTVEHRLCP